ncbi:MAG: glycosyltransferase [Phenylobacterium sp.]
MADIGHVSICIVGFRNPQDIVACLGALAKSAYRDFSVVICENGGAEAYAGLVRAVPAALPGGQAVTAFDAGANLGYAGGVNACIAASREAAAWWVLNPDTLPHPDALRHLADRLAVGDCGLVGATIHGPDGLVESRGGRWIAPLARAESIDRGKRLDDPTSQAGIEADLSFVSGASMLVGPRFAERVGLMREDYFLYGEEVEWCLRGLARGERLGLAVEARVLHNQGSTTGSVADLRRRSRMAVFLDERNKLLTTRDCAPSLLPVVAVGSFLMLWLRFARRAAWRQLGYAMQGWWAGLLGRRGVPDFVAPQKA